MTLPPLPQPSHPMIDPETGKVDRVWYTYLRALDKVLRELGAA